MPDYSLAEKSKGTLYNEGDKRKSDKAPHFRGKVVVTREQAKHIAAHFKGDPNLESVDFRLAAWKNQGDSGVYLSLSGETMPPDGAQPAPPPVAASQPAINGMDDFEDDIPF